MNRGKAMRQMTIQMGLPLEDRGETLNVKRSGEAGRAARGEARSGVGHEQLMELVVGRENCRKAFKRVRQNRGSPGVDGMTVGELEEYLWEHWIEIREQLLAGTYHPMAVRRHVIPKSGGGVRELGIPTVLDRFIQQCVLQVLQPIFDPTFSEHSVTVRPCQGDEPSRSGGGVEGCPILQPIGVGPGRHWGRRRVHRVHSR